MPKFAKTMVVFLFALLAFSLAKPALALNPADTLDPDGPDSVWVECTKPAGDSVIIDVMLFSDNTADKVVGIVWPMLLTVSNSAMVRMDTTLKVIYGDTGAGQLTPTLLKPWSNETFGVGPPPNHDPTQSPFHFVFGGVDFTFVGVSGSGVMGHVLLHTNGDTCTITLDTLSAALPPAFTTSSTVEYMPIWNGPYSCIGLDVRDYKPGTAARPTNFALSQNFPNPFNASTVIRFTLPKPSHVRLDVFNVLGQKVNTLIDDDLTAGFKEVLWDGKDQTGNIVATGIYFYRIKAGDDFSDLKKMILIK